MSCRLVAVAFGVRDPARAAAFWAAVLGRHAVADARGVLLPAAGTQVGLRFTESRAGQAGPDRLHLHLTSTTRADQDRVVAQALALGGAHLDVGQLPEEGHVVLADPEGDALCVIEPGNTFLAGCGFLGEVACEGSRDVGLFWAEALGWPLVWDHDEETAVQHPRGGTKVAWAVRRCRPGAAGTGSGSSSRSSTVTSTPRWRAWAGWGPGGWAAGQTAWWS
ncbi:hypothetical protein CHMI_01641 [Cellulomonas hominis]|nr:hypothetical protein CHMI_01641 [Cellulomonas hominis]